MAKLVAAPKTSKALPSLAEFRKHLKAGTPSAQLLRDERNAR